MRTFLSEAWALTKPYWKSSERKLAFLLLAVIVGMNLGEVYISVLINQWNNDFYNSLQEVDKDAFMRALGRFSYLAASYIILAVYKVYLNQMLRIKWRRWLTAHYLTDWLAQQNYYRIQLFGHKADNPDQRIADDIEQFIALALGLTLGLMSAVVTLFSFLGILWKLSGSLDFEMMGMHVHVPAYMVWVAIVYAFFGTWITMKIGRPLVKLNFDQQRFEADFRFSLVRLRENCESIAFYRGEGREKDHLLTRFSAVVGNFWQIMRRQKMLNWFTSGYQQIAIIFPFVVAAPRFFAKEIQLGGLMQTASAFGHVQGALSYIIDAYTSIATWKAVTDRLTGFNRSIAQAERAMQADGRFHRQQADGVLEVKDLTIRLPEGAVLLSHLNLALHPGDSLLITGASGTGKSTLLRSLAGIWPFVEGSVTLPERSRMMFLPQKPYMPLATLKQVLSYPNVAEVNDEELRHVLYLCQLDHLSGRLDEAEQWSHVLSLGEQQRVAFARILLAKPEFVFLDEATSALDEPTEAHLYEMLKARLPHTAVVSVAHRSSLKAWHIHELSLGR